jgi:hypothetical protein
MKTALLFVVVILLCGCKVIPEAKPKDPSPQLLKTPDGLVTYFKECVRIGNYYKAYLTLSPSSRNIINETEFVMALKNYLPIRRLIRGAVYREGESKIDHKRGAGMIRLCNRKFGACQDVKICKIVFGGESWWHIDISREKLSEWIELAMTWDRFQQKLAGGYLYVYPPDWEFEPLPDGCRCKLEER